MTSKVVGHPARVLSRVREGHVEGVDGHRGARPRHVSPVEQPLHGGLGEAGAGQIAGQGDAPAFRGVALARRGSGGGGSD